MTEQEIIDVVTAHKNGEEIQFYNGDVWQDAVYPKWNFADCVYRVKPNSPYRPYTRKELIEATKEHSCFICSNEGGYIDGYTGRIKLMTEDNCTTTFGVKSFSNLLETCVWADDDSPCGVKEEQPWTYN